MLINQVYEICQKYKNKGWEDLLMQVAGLNISQPSADQLKQELRRKLTAGKGRIDRTMAGFEDFNMKGKRGIEPGKPARSLLYHAFASPGVVDDSLTAYPTLAELEVIENYIYGCRQIGLSNVKAMAGGRPVNVCVFAYEYRTGWNTPARKSADLCFSRTGVSRVGNTTYSYQPEKRGFVPWVDGDDDSVLRVIPCRYGAFIAIQIKGDDSKLGDFGPMGKNFLRDHPDLSMAPMGYTPPDDNELGFWVPVHKLFAGPECLTDFSSGPGLKINLIARHVNKKLAKIRSRLRDGGYETGWKYAEKEFHKPPFTQTDGLADFAPGDAGLGASTLVPQAQTIVREAKVGNTPLIFSVNKHEPSDDNLFWYFGATFSITTDDKTDARKAPEYVNVKQSVDPEKDLNKEKSKPIVELMEEGGFEVKSYQDFSADGWIEAVVPQLNTQYSQAGRRSAYSLVAPPHFIPYVIQREIIEWTEEWMRDYRDWPRMWEVVPWALSEDRIPPNITLENSGFSTSDDTISAIVTGLEVHDLDRANIVDFDVRRSVTLPDAAAGTYAPGWDTSFDTDDFGRAFLAAYGLGSPFPEDAMICSALGSFWPTAAPDTTRLYAPESLSSYRTVAPLTDEEIGLDGGVAWDGTPAPTVGSTETGTVVDYLNIEYNDYVQNLLSGKFTIKLLQRISNSDYKNRVLAMYHAYMALIYLEVRSEGGRVSRSLPKNWIKRAPEWALLSFKAVDAIPHDDLCEAKLSKDEIAGPIYKMRMFKAGDSKPRSPSFNQIRVEVTEETDLYAYSGGVILRSEATTNCWEQGFLPR